MHKTILSIRQLLCYMLFDSQNVFDTAIGKEHRMEVREEQGFSILDMDPYVAKDSVPGICEQLDPSLKEEGKEYILDMWEAKTLNSSMASVIVHMIKQITQAKSTLHIVNVTQNVLNALQTLHLTDMVKVYETALDFEIDKGTEVKSIMH